MRVRDMMTRAPATCEPATPLRLVAQLMLGHDCAAIPITSSGRLVGIVTDRDIVCRGVAAAGGVTVDLPASSVMSAAVLTVGPNDSLEQAAMLMMENHIHHVPVIDDRGQLLGIIAHSDLGRRMTNREFRTLARQTSIRTRSSALRSSALMKSIIEVNR